MIGELVRVHLNLHRGDFSISDPKTGRVMASCDDVTLSGVTFQVSETTRQRVIAKQRRRVHAWAKGTLVAVDSKPTIEGHPVVTYNPYRAPTFTKGNGSPVHAAEMVAFTDRKGYLMLPCGCIPHETRMRGMWGFYCDTEEQPYCNFECPHWEGR